MGKPSKATKKYSQKHLGDEIKARKKQKQVKFREKKKWGSTKPAKAEDEDGSAESESEELKQAQQVRAKLGTGDAYAGNVDDFLEKGFFEALEDDDDDDEHGGEGGDGSDEEGSDEEGSDDGDGDEEAGDEDEDEEMDPEQHRQDLERLKEEQPEFYKYLQENDEGLLKFGESDEEGGEGEEGDDAASADGSGDGEGDEEKADGPRVLTLKILNDWSKSLIAANSYKALRDLVRAFESACHLDDVEDLRGKDTAKKAKKRARGGGAGARLQFRIISGQVFERLMRMCVTKMHVYFGIYLQLKQHVDTSAPRKINPQLSARWKRASVIVKAYVKAMTNFVETLTDPSMVHLLQRHTERMMPYVRPFPKVARKLLKVTLRVFGALEENRVQAFLVVRRLALEMPYPFIEGCFKGLYLTFVRHSKFTNVNVAAGQAFMAQCVVELFGLDLSVAYEHAFVYIRQLAIQLRAALTATAQKTQDTHQVISSWQFVNSIKLWTRMLATYPGKDQLAALVYPLVQVSLGVITHLNAPKYLPLRLQMCQALIRLQRQAQVYIPLGPHLVDALARNDLLTTSAKPGQAALDFNANLKVNKNVLSSRTYQDAALKNSIEALMLYAGATAYSAGFPEFVVPIVMQLKLFAKNTQVARFRRQVRDAIERLDRQAAFISRLRAQAKVSPQDELPLNALLDSDPHHQAPLFQLYEQSAQMAMGELDSLLQARNTTVHAARAKSGNASSDDDDDGADDDEEEEEDEDEDEEGEEEEGRGAEPRWKEARREKRKRERSAKRSAKGGDSDDDDSHEEAPAEGKRGKKKGRGPKGGGAPKDMAALTAKAAKAGADQVEDFAFSSDED